MRHRKSDRSIDAAHQGDQVASILGTLGLETRVEVGAIEAVEHQPQPARGGARERNRYRARPFYACQPGTVDLV